MRPSAPRAAQVLWGERGVDGAHRSPRHQDGHRDCRSGAREAVRCGEQRGWRAPRKAGTGGAAAWRDRQGRRPWSEVRPGGQVVPGRCGSRGPAALSPQDAVLTAVRAWEAQNLRALREQEARAQQEQEQEQLLTYTREDAYNAVRPPRPPSLPTAACPAAACSSRRSPRPCREVPEHQGARSEQRSHCRSPVSRRSTSTKEPTGRRRSCRCVPRPRSPVPHPLAFREAPPHAPPSPCSSGPRPRRPKTTTTSTSTRSCVSCTRPRPSPRPSCPPCT